MGLAIIVGTKRDENTGKTVDIYAPNPDPPQELPRCLSLRMLLDNVKFWETAIDGFAPDTLFTASQLKTILTHIKTAREPVRRSKHQKRVEGAA
jgi:hypothetical protein